MSIDAKRAEWFQSRQKTWGGFTGLTNRMIDSPACAELSGTAMKVLILFWEKVEYMKEKRKPGQESSIGRLDKIKNNGELSFTYLEASYRGIKSGRFTRAIRQLFRYGFIDVSVLGRGRKGNYTKFALSDRWKKYDTSGWEEIPFPENFAEGFRSKEFKERMKDKRGKENSIQKWTLPTSKNERYEGEESINSVQKRTLKTPFSPESQRPKMDDFLDLSMPTKNSKGIQGEDSALESKVQSIAAHRADGNPSPKAWRPPLSEIRENVKEILKQRPDPRAKDHRFVRSLADQLVDAQRGRLDPGRVHRDLQARHDLDTWTTDLLFAIGGVNYQQEATH